jgi:hypothetical protein
MNAPRLNAHPQITVFALTVLSVSVLAGCGRGVTASVGTGPVQNPISIPTTVTVSATPSGSITTAQALGVSVAVSASAGTPSGTVILSSGNYESFPIAVTGGTATITVPAGLLALGADTLTATFSPTTTSSYSGSSGTANVTVVASGAALPVVTYTNNTYSTAAYGSPFRALPLPNGQVLVSVSATTSGIVAFNPVGGGGLQLSCFNYVRPQFVQDGASDFGFTLTPNGLGLAATLGVDGAIFYNLGTLETCTSTGLQISQGPVSADEGSFDVVITPDGKYAFVANEYGVASGATTEGNIGVIALQYDSSGIVTTGTTLVGQISTGGQSIAGITLSPDGTRLYATSEVAINGGVAAGAGNPILARTGCYQQAGGGTQINGLLSVIDVAQAEAKPGSSAIISTVNAGCSPVRAVETADNSTLWVSARGDNRVLAFSTGMLETNPGNALLGYADTGGTAQVGLRLFDNGKVLAVANSNRFNTGTANMTILSVAVPASASVVQTIPTGLFPREITVGSDGLTLYLTNYNSQSFQVVTTSVH